MMLPYSNGELAQMGQAGKNAEHCVFCGAIIPEGIMVCPVCEGKYQRLKRTDEIRETFDRAMKGKKTMNKYCSTCLNYVAPNICEFCDGTEENHIYYKPDFVKKNTKPRYLEAEKLKRQMGLMPMDFNTRDEMWMRESDIACYIDTCPEADVVERKKGKWLPKRLGDCECSNCHKEYGICGGLLGDYNFCPGCGADMREMEKNDAKIH